MNTVKLLHNPKAGNEDHSKKELVSMIENNGYKCLYASTKNDGWKDIEPETDLIAIAGGDGTVGKVAIELLKRQPERPVTTILPSGTANNISRSLGIEGTYEQLIAGWHDGNMQEFDAGLVIGLEKEPVNFIEGVGFGVFPRLVEKMKKRPWTEDDTEKEIEAALKKLEEIATEYKGRACKLYIDGVDHSGNYLMVEIMNINCVGPNLDINPKGSTSDGWLDVVLVAVEDRAQLVAYVQSKINGQVANANFKTIQGREVELSWDGGSMHVDDEIIKIEKQQQLVVKVQQGALRFLLP